MKNLLYLWLSIVGYVFLSFILVLRDEWALKSIAQFFPSIQETLFAAREFALEHYLNTIPTVLYAVVVALAFFFYWRLVKGRWIKTQTTTSVIAVSLVLQLTLLVSYPVLSTDVFDYILVHRVAFVYHQNPWTTPSITFAEDPFINLGSWQRIPSVYGPTHHLLSIFPAIIGADGLVRSVVAYKTLMIVATLITILLVSKVIKGPDKARNLALFAFNPLLLIESAGNAHNDIIMVAFMVASFLALKYSRNLMAGVLLGLGTMVKLYAMVLLPMYLLLMKNRQKLPSVLSLLAGFTGIVLFGIFLMGTESLVQYAKLMDWVFTLRLNSLGNLLNTLPNWVFTIPFALLSLVVLRKITDERQLIRTYVGLTLIYLLFVVPLYWAWYPIWYLPFLSLLPITKLTNTALTLSFTSAAHYAILFLSHRFNYQHIFWTIAIYLFLVLPPIYVYLFVKDGKTA